MTLLAGAGIGICVTLAANLATTVYLHRTLSHKAMTMRTPLAFCFRFFLWMSTGITARQWVAVHRKHHAFTDETGDPHSPVLLGWIQVQMKNLVLYRKEAHDPETIARYAKDLPVDRWDRVLFDKPLLGLGLGVVSLVVLSGPAVGLLAAFAHVNLYLATSAAVNAMGHHFGRRPYANRAGNLQWLAWLTAGEGLHNNHHAAPTTARLSHRWFEFDPGWWAICVFRWLGLVKLRFRGVVLMPGMKAGTAASDTATAAA